MLAAETAVAAVGSFSLLAGSGTSLLIMGAASLLVTGGVSLILLVLFSSLSCFCGVTGYIQMELKFAGINFCGLNKSLSTTSVTTIN